MQRSSWQKANAEILAQYAEDDREIQLAESGAIVAMDPKTGRVLGMISYPEYDLSMFNGGTVDNAKWNAVLELNDPLYNRAISTGDTPGSIFKLCTALAGLAEGVITPTETIDDIGAFNKTNSYNPAKCWISSTERYKHTNQTIVEAIKNSCNYYFYETSYRLGVTKLYEWAAKLGLTTKTNIELPGETTSFVGNQDMLYDPNYSVNNQYTAKPLLAAKAIRERIYEISDARGMDLSEEVVESAVTALLKISVSYETKNDWLAPIREVLQYDLGIPSSYITNNFLVNEFVTYLQDLFWTPNETIMLGIGQSITQLTPIAVARYVSAIANGGTVYDAQIVDKIISADGQVVLDKEPVVANQIDTDSAYFAAIQEGMKDVASEENGGTAARQFADARYPIAAKTGTSQRTKLDVENNAWLVAYAPYDDPKIVVVVYIQNGYAGPHSAYAAKATIEYFLDHLGGYDSTTVDTEYTLSD